MSWLRFCWAGAVSLLPTVLVAQHPQTSDDTPVLAASGCDYCHGAHVGPRSRFTLRLGDDDWPTEIEAWLQTQAPGAGAVSASCARCHLGQGLRERQPEISDLGVAQPSDGALYLPLAPGASHPLGDVNLLIPRSVGRRGAPSRRQLESPLQFDTRTMVIECTECHDPHDRLSPIPDASEQRLICGECHRGGEYLQHEHVTLACSDCHDLHRGKDDTRLLRQPTPDLLCLSCHGSADLSALSAAPGRRRVSPGAAAAAAPAHGPEGACTECHVPHGGGSVRPAPR